MDDFPQDAVLRIAKWDTEFESAETRKYQRLRWIPLPVAFDSAGYEQMLDDFGEDAAAIYGAWCALLCVAATCPARGVLATSRGRPLTVQRLSRRTGLPVRVFERLIDWAINPEVGWIEIASASDLPDAQELTSAGRSPGDHQEITGRSPGDYQENGRRKSGLHKTRQTVTLEQQTDRQTDQNGGGRSVGRSVDDLRWDWTADDLSRAAREFRRVPGCTPEEIAPPLLAAVVAIDRMIARGFRRDLERTLREGSKGEPIRRKGRYVQAAVEQRLADEGFGVEEFYRRVAEHVRAIVREASEGASEEAAS